MSTTFKFHIKRLVKEYATVLHKDKVNIAKIKAILSELLNESLDEIIEELYKD